MLATLVFLCCSLANSKGKLHWLDVPERIKYKLGVTVYHVCMDGHLGTSQITSSQPLMLLLAVVVYVLQT